MKNIIEYEIINWERYNPRSDRTNHSWFRLENTIATEPKLHGLTAGQKFIAVCLIAEVSKVRPMPTGKAKLLFSWLQDQLKVKRFDIESVIKHLIAVEIMRLPDDTTETPLATNSESNFHSVGPTYVRTYERTNEQLITATAPEFDFESLYQKYPRKLGKSEGLKRCHAQIKTEADYLALDIAIARYKRYIATQGTEDKFVKHFSSFMTNWRDWLDQDVGRTPSQTPVIPVRRIEAPEVEEKVAADHIRRILAESGFGKTNAEEESA